MGESSRAATVEGLRISCNELTARDLPLEIIARTAREAGFEGLGILPSTIDELGVRKVAAVLDGEGLSATSVCAFAGLIGPTPEAQAARLAEAARRLAAAAELGVPLVVVVGGPAGPLGPRQAWEKAVFAVDELLERAAREGAEVLVEPLHPVLVAESVVTSLADAHALVGRSGTGGVVLDTWHVWWDARLREQADRAGRRVRIVHLSDWAPPGPGADLDRLLPGEGVAGLPALCADLLDGGFDGWWEVEIQSEKLWAGDQVSLIRASYDAARGVLETAVSPAAENAGVTDPGR